MNDFDDRLKALEHESDARSIDARLAKEALKEGLKEFLDEKLSQFGWWSLKGLAALGLAAVIWLFFATHGWKTAP